MNVRYNYGLYTDDNRELYVIRSILTRYLFIMAPKDPLVDMPIEDQELFYAIHVLCEVVAASNDVVDMWNWLSRSDIRKLLIIVSQKEITNSIDQRYILLFISAMDDTFDSMSFLEDSDIVEYYGTRVENHQ